MPNFQSVSVRCFGEEKILREHCGNYRQFLWAVIANFWVILMLHLREMIQKNPKASVIPIFAEALDEVQMRTLVNESVAVVTGPVAGFIGTDEGGYRYIIGKNEAVEKPDLREFAKVLNARLNGRGGGSAKMIQGSVMANRKEIESFLNEIM